MPHPEWHSWPSQRPGANSNRQDRPDTAIPLGSRLRCYPPPLFRWDVARANPAAADWVQLTPIGGPNAVGLGSHYQSGLPPSRVRRACDHREVQHGMHTRTAIYPAPLLEDLMNLVTQALVPSLTMRQMPTAPAIIPTFCDLKYTTHDPHGKLLLVVGDELVSHRGLCQKIAAALLRISRSCRKVSTSRRKRRTSSSSSV